MSILRVTCLCVVLHIVTVYSGAVTIPKVINEQVDIAHKLIPETDPFDFASYLGKGDQIVAKLSKRQAKSHDCKHDNKRNKRAVFMTKADVKTLEDLHYEVKYNTKFAFQNVDNATEKLMKYNRTEHVYYGGNYNDQRKDPPNYRRSQTRTAVREPPRPVRVSSLEMQRCHKMVFKRGEDTQQLPGSCFTCSITLGAIRSVKGCPRIDCDQFVTVDKHAPYPKCCPSCRGF